MKEKILWELKPTKIVSCIIKGSENTATETLSSLCLRNLSQSCWNFFWTHPKGYLCFICISGLFDSCCETFALWRTHLILQLTEASRAKHRARRIRHVTMLNFTTKSIVPLFLLMRPFSWHNKSSCAWKGSEGHELTDTIRWMRPVIHLASH